MAEGALGISTGIGQGEAQIIKPFQSPVTPQQYGAVMAAQQKAQQDKKAKTLANIETLDFKGMPNEAGLFAKAYDEIVQFVEDNVYDPYVDIKMKQKISDLKTRANMSYDRKMAINNIVGDVQKGEGKNIYLGIDPALQRAVADMDYATFSNTEAYGKENAERMAKLSTVKTVPIYDIGAASLDLQRGMAAWGQANKDKNGNWKVPENVIDDFVNKELMGHPNAYATFEVAMKNDPVGAKEANYKVEQYAFNILKKSISAEGSTKSRDMTINIGGGAGNTPNSASVFNGNTVFGKGDTSFVQENQPAASFPVKSTIASPDPDTFDPVSFKKLSSGAVNNVQYGSMIVSDTLDQDLDFGGGYVIPKGTPIPQGKSMGDIALMYFGQQAGFDKDKLELLKTTPEYKAYSTKKPKTTIGLFAVGVGKNSDGDEMSVYTPLQKVWGAIQGGLSKDDEGKLNTQGKIIYDEYIKKGGKSFSIVGVTDSSQPTGGAKTTSVPTVGGYKPKKR